MKKSLYPIMLAGLSLIGMTLACNLMSPQVQEAETETPSPTAIPTETAAPAPSPTEVPPTLTATPELAPICAPDAAMNPTPEACQMPMAAQSSIFCTEKIPYNLILMNESATYEVLTVGFQCTDAGIRDGKRIVACTGLMATSYQLRVCDPACAVPTVQAEITQCPQDYLYDNLRGCCAQTLPASDQNCMLLSLTTKSCVVNCAEYTKKAACEKNAYACVWDDANDVCQVRQ